MSFIIGLIVAIILVVLFVKLALGAIGIVIALVLRMSRVPAPDHRTSAVRGVARPCPPSAPPIRPVSRPPLTGVRLRRGVTGTRAALS